MTRRPGLFPTFFLTGFECSSFVWKDRGRRDLAAETQHRQRAREDYAALRDLGIAVAREGIPWPLVDRGGTYDLAPFVDPLVEAMNAAQVLPIWDLCHYGYPDGLSIPSARRSSRASPPTARGGRVRGAARARAALLHPHQRDHLLGLLRRRVGVGGAVREGP